MEVALKKEKYNQFVPVWHDTFAGEFASDCVVPDTMPDIGDLLDSEGTLLLRSKTTEAGFVAMAASANVTALYAPEDGGTLRSLSVVIPVEVRLESPQIEENCRTVCRMRIRSLDTKMVNSRKITVRADVTVEVWCYGESTMQIPHSLEQDEMLVHVRKEDASFVHISDVREKAFVITDQYSLPSGVSAVTEILSQRTVVHTEDVKFVSGKVVFRGHLSARLLFAGAEPGQFIPAHYESDFSQIMEADVSGEDVMPDIDLLLTGIYFDLPGRDDSSGKIGAEMHMAAQCVCRKKQQITYIDDLYSNKSNLLPERKELSCVSDVQPVTMRQTVTGRAESANGECEVLYASAAVSGITVEGETVKTAVNVRLLCRQNNGQYVPVRCRLGAEFTTELSAGAALQNVTVRVVDVYYSTAGGATDLRVVLQMDGQRITKRLLNYVEAVAVDESDNMRVNAPSITLVNSNKGADMWQLAKRYRSSLEAIAAANAGNNGRLLLIPKSR